MKQLKENSLRAVVFSLLFGVTVIISVSLALNRLSTATSSYRGIVSFATLPVFFHAPVSSLNPRTVATLNSCNQSISLTEDLPDLCKMPAEKVDGSIRANTTNPHEESSATIPPLVNIANSEDLEVDISKLEVPNEELDASIPPLDNNTKSDDFELETTKSELSTEEELSHLNKTSASDISEEAVSASPSKADNAGRTDVELKPNQPGFSNDLVSAPATRVRDEDQATGPDSLSLSTSSLSGEADPRQIQDRSVASKQRVFQPASLPHYPFVKFSAYRLSVNTIFVTGISSYVARSFDHDIIAHSCEWHPANGTLPMTVHKENNSFVVTKADHIFIKGDENHGTYSPIIINCTFADGVGADGKGGLLVLRISTGYNRWASNLPVVAMEEHAGDADNILNPPEQLPHRYAFCGPPIHGRVRGDWLLQWMTYHNYLWEGQAHFFFYNLGGMVDEDLHLFQEYMDAGRMSITNILDPNLSEDYPTWYFHQVLLINDCLHRSRFMAERVFFFDYDEFLQVPAPMTLPRLLKKYEDAPWISFGNMYANTHDCTYPDPSKSLAPVERMLWRRPAPECREKKEDGKTDPWLCIGPLGRRKYVVNPRKTFAAGVHFVSVPEKGIDLRATVARMLHYRSSPLPRTPLCVETVSLAGEEKRVLDGDWIRDETTSRIYSRAKRFRVVPLSDTTNRLGL